MLGVLYASVGRPLEAPHALAPQRLQQLLCVSTAADMKTATCNVDCNSDTECPDACFCLGRARIEEDLSLAMSGEDLQMISDELDTGKAMSARLTTRFTYMSTPMKACSSLSDTVEHSWCDKNCNAEPPNCPETVCKCDGTRPACTESGKNVNSFGIVAVPCCAGMQVVNSTCTRDAPAAKAPAGAGSNASTASGPAWRSKLSAANPARLPEEDVVGFYMKSWTCKNLDTGPCLGPPRKNLNVAFSGEGTLETV